jgi:sugar/nucleoside kinase (ribokinase family)
MIVNVAGQDRRFIHIFGANAEFAAEDIPSDLARRCKVFYLGGYLIMPFLTQEKLIPVFDALRQAGTKVLIDVATPGKRDYLPHLDRLLGHVDVFHCNNHEGKNILGENDPLRQAEAFHRLGAETAVVTLGADGAFLVSSTSRLKAGAFSVPFVDGSGGGDAFCAGYIYGLLKGSGVEDCLLYASALGASCVRAIGTTPGVFTEHECLDFLSKNQIAIDRI